MRVEHEYERGGTLQYLAAWDCHQAKLFGRCEPRTGILPFDRLVEQVMTTRAYARAHRVFWIETMVLATAARAPSAACRTDSETCGEVSFGKPVTTLHAAEQATQDGADFHFLAYSSPGIPA